MLGQYPARVRLRIDLAYDGTDFHGWASQRGLRTVQSTVEEALRVVLRLSAAPRVTVAGRTDAGVHARGQVLHVDVMQVPDAPRLARQLNGVLPEDVRVLAVGEVPQQFDARFSALARRYSYRVSDAACVDPLERHTTVLHPRALDVDRLNAASTPLLGLHDFAAFCRRNDTGTTIRTLQEFTWHRDEYGIIIAHLQADAFCHSMVRALVGALLMIGDGRRPVAWASTLLAEGIRRSIVAPAHGLVLEEIRYPDASTLATRQEVTRQMRQAQDLEGPPAPTP